MGPQAFTGYYHARRSAAIHVSDEIALIFRREYGRAVAVLTRSLGDISLAEEAVQDAFTIAIKHWQQHGIPPAPSGWIITTARNNALAAGVNQINGLPIGGDSSVISFYQTKIKGGANSFVLPAASFADFDSAVRIKIFSELTGANPTPLPSAAVMGSALMGGLAFLRKRLKKA